MLRIAYPFIFAKKWIFNSKFVHFNQNSGIEISTYLLVLVLVAHTTPTALDDSQSTVGHVSL